MILDDSLLMFCFQARDRFTREFMETAFHTVTIVTIVMVIVEVLLNFDIFELKLENFFFGKV